MALRSFKPDAPFVAGAVLTVAAAAALAKMAGWLAHLLQGPVCWDSFVYRALGKAVAHGLVPYRDVFDFKPPGIFLLSGLGEAIGNGALFGAVLDATIFATIAVVPALAVWRRAAKHAGSVRYAATAATLSFATALAISLYVWCVGYQVECHGVFFASLYAVALFHWGRERSAPLIITTPLILMAVWMKEPFVLIVAAVGLIFSNDAKSLFRNLAAPAVIGAAVGTAILAALGWLEPLLTDYLPAILRVSGEELSRYPRGDLWARPFSMRAARHLWSGTPFLAVTVALLPLLPLLLSWQERRAIRWTAFKMAAAAYLASLAILAGPYLDHHHHAVALPVFLALFLLAVREALARPPDLTVRILAVAIMACASVAILTARPARGEASIRRMRAWTNAPRNAAGPLNAILATCPQARWMFVGSLRNPILPAFSSRPPDGRISFQIRHFVDRRGWMRDAFFMDIANADLVVVDRWSFTSRDYGRALPRLKRVLKTEFTKSPWPCAEGRKGTGIYDFYFRKPEAGRD